MNNSIETPMTQPILKKSATLICQITHKHLPLSEVTPLSLVRPGIAKLIRNHYPKISMDGYISNTVLQQLRKEYIETVFKTEQGDLSKLDKEVVRSLVAHESIVKRVSQNEGKLTLGQRVADKVASFGGSWTFIGIFFFVLFAWIAVNTIVLYSKPFDAYPFLLLNICLSCLAAIQAPIIMMSQNRKEDKDRKRAENDYKINLKAELEIRHLHEKIDNLTRHQWQRLLEIQQLQMDLMEERSEKKNRRR